MLIIASQLRNFFGLDIERGMSFLRTLGAFALHLGDVKPYVSPWPPRPSPRESSRAASSRKCPT